MDILCIFDYNLTQYEVIIIRITTSTLHSNIIPTPLKDYDLIICGHSLGAGVAAVLSVMLKDEYPTLRGYCYSPVGGGNDIIPRLVKLSSIRE